MAVSGIAGLKRKLVALPKLVEKRARDAMEKSADEIVGMMKRLVPIDRGELRDSIGWTWGEIPTGAVAMAASAPSESGMKITIFAGDEVAFYARWVEFGTVKSPAHPFFFVSYRSLRTRAKRRITTATRKALREVTAMPDSQEAA